MVTPAHKEESTMATVRMHLPQTIHFITNRCEQERFFMLPSQTINEIIGAWFARAVCLYGDGIEVYSFIFLSNHFHFLIKDTKGTLAQFMDYFQGNVARAVNREIGRKGSFWAREYDDVIVDGDAEFINRYVYTTCNAVKAGLVERASEWTGWSSLQGALSDGAYSFYLLNRTKYYNAKRNKKKVNKAKYIETWKFALSTPPMWEGRTDEERTKLINELVTEAEQDYKAKREGKPVLGLAQLKHQLPTDRPRNPEFKPRIKFISFDKEKRKELLDGYRLFNGGYKETFGGFLNAARKGRRPTVEWPHGSYPPSCHRPMNYEAAA
jgi:putative transposase